MSILKRLQNLWELSEFKPQFNENSLNVIHPNGKILTMIEKPVPKLAQIIKRTTPAKEFLKE